MEIRKEIEALYAEVTQNRRNLHQIPEIGLDTIMTAEYIVRELEKYGVDSIAKNIAKNGIIAHLHAINKTDAGIAFRADMDALPIQEETGLAFKSTISGRMHACGHDGHMAALLGLCAYLCKHREQLKQNVTFIFQPAEEGPGGASKMIEEGLFHDYPIQMVFGTHLMPDVPHGKIGCKAGPLMARNGEITIEIKGQSAHGAQPQFGKDCVVAMSALVMNLQTIVSRSMDPLNNTVLSFGEMHAGQVKNVVADYAIIKGTMRSFSDEMYDLMKTRIQQICEGIQIMYQVEVICLIEDYYLVVKNDENLTAILKECVKEDYLEVKTKMISEDFSFYQKEVPGIFFYTGVQTTEFNKGIHDCQFNFDEHALLYTIETNIRIMEHLNVL